MQVVTASELASRKLESALNILKSLGYSVKLVHNVDYSTVKDLFSDLLLYVFTNPHLLAELSSRAIPMLEVAVYSDEASVALEDSDVPRKFSLFVELRRSKEGRDVLKAKLLAPVPLLIVPRFRLDLLAILHSKVFNVSRDFSERIRDNKTVYLISQESFQKYLEELKKLREYLPLLRILSNLLKLWATMHNVEIVQEPGGYLRLVEIAKLPKTGYIIWVVK